MGCAMLEQLVIHGICIDEMDVDNQKIEKWAGQIRVGLVLGGLMFSLTMCTMATCQFAALAPPKSYSISSKPATTNWSKIEISSKPATTIWSKIENSELSVEFPVRKEHSYLLIGRSNVEVWSGRSPNLHFVLISGYVPDTAGGVNVEGQAISKFEKLLLSDSCSYYDRSLLPERSQMQRLNESEIEGNGWQGRLLTFGADDKESATLLVARETARQTPFYAALITGSKETPDVEHFVKAFTVKHMSDEEFTNKTGITPENTKD